ncbi:Vps36-domain-containing protein [Mytilinidion resinicola]|uniref:Vacuolar protein-sorting-associated protein 36 n=1 Tax=Mytilinidion resinicola TaxID=574789 RepID=A0A6A6Y9Z1_9PEZI|nr:Vps36-domain-containing protein [Mytilinidion resinicola]KAF2805642.1 Vps36-domain-containing protein [Mytilinidion resinicola]
MFLHQVDLTTALRPSLLPEETLLLVQDSIGLYEGKFKIPQFQNGHVYLTSHRVCYVDNDEPRKRSVAINLKDVERPEFYAGFLKSSAKVTFYPKPSKRLSFSTRSPSTATGRTISSSSSSTPPERNGSPLRSLASSPAPSTAASATWICPICSFSNPVPSNFDPATANAHTPLPPCLACGIKPPLVHLVKAAISSMTNRQSQLLAPTPQRAHHDKLDSSSASGSRNPLGQSSSSASFTCPRCTFRNHPSLLTCEICGASLVSIEDKRLASAKGTARSESPGPALSGLSMQDEAVESVKFSFRGGGEKVFFERVKNALVQRKWLLQSAPPVPKPNRLSGTFDDGYSSSSDQSSRDPERQKVVGIAGLERRGLEQRKNNELVIGTAFEDLEALMTSAKEIIALAESFASQANLGTNGNSEASSILSQSASALGLVTTKDMLGSGSDSLYVSELSRNLAEWLTDDTRGVLKREGGIMTLVDLWAVFNRARGGVELVSPTDFEKAARLWDKLKLPVRLRMFKSGLLVVQGRDRTDEKTVAALLSWLRELHRQPPASEVTWDWRLYGRGVTAQEVAERFGWSVGVASEELEMAEERGVLCREQGLDGLRFWENWLLHTPEEGTLVI